MDAQQISSLIADTKADLATLAGKTQKCVTTQDFLLRKALERQGLILEQLALLLPKKKK